MDQSTNAAPEAATTNAQTDLVEINDLDKLVQALTGWHSSKVALLQHMQAIPEGVEITADIGNGPVPLSGDLLAGFKFGINFALGELGTLPFAAEFDTDEQRPLQDAANDAVAHTG